MFPSAKKNYDIFVFVFCLVYFFAKSIYFIFNIPITVPPDEVFHIKQIILYFVHPGFLIPADELNAYQGTYSRNFFLYHFLLGKLLHFNVLVGLPEIIYLRLLNIFFSLLYLTVFFKLAKLVLREKLLVSFAFIVQTNILMFTFLSSSVNYDNLVNLLSICSIYFLFRSIVSEKPVNLIYFLICILLGTLTKKTVFPLALILFVIALFEYRGYLFARFTDVSRKSLRKLRPYQIIAIVAVSILLVTNIFIHTHTVYRYGTLSPSCNKIYSHAICMRDNPVYAKYNTLKANTKDDPKADDPVRYFFLWSDYMIEKTLGIFGYSSFYQGNIILGIAEILIILSVLIGVRKIEFNDKISIYLVSLVVAYSAFVFYYANYKGYSVTGLAPRYTFIAIQGRYIFPVLSVIVLLFAKFILSANSRHLKLATFLSLSVFFSYASFPMYYFAPDENKLISNKELQLKHIQSLNRSQKFIHP